jgi:HTH-type transcriptional regulator/antitoxin HigA
LITGSIADTRIWKTKEIFFKNPGVFERAACLSHFKDGLRIMDIKPIRTNKDYEQALERLDIIFDAKKGSLEGDEFEVLGILIDQYENQHFPVGLPDPIEAIKFRMEQMDYNQKDLSEILGLKSRASEILNRKRRLSLDMIRQLHEKLHIPTDVLIQEY